MTDGRESSKDTKLQKTFLMTDMYRFNQYLALADQLANAATKEDLENALDYLQSILRIMNRCMVRCLLMKP